MVAPPLDKLLNSEQSRKGLAHARYIEGIRIQNYQGMLRDILFSE